MFLVYGRSTADATTTLSSPTTASLGRETSAEKVSSSAREVRAPTQPQCTSASPVGGIRKDGVENKEEQLSYSSKREDRFLYLVSSFQFSSVHPVCVCVCVRARACVGGAGVHLCVRASLCCLLRA